MLDVLVRKALASGTLRQSYVSAPYSVCALRLRFRNLRCIGDGLLGTGKIGVGVLVSGVGDRRSGGFVISTMEDVVELRDGVATLDTYRHSALESGEGLHIAVPVFWRTTPRVVELCEVLCMPTNLAYFNPSGATYGRDWGIVRTVLSIRFHKKDDVANYLWYMTLSSPSWGLIHAFHSFIFNRLLSHDLKVKHQPWLAIRRIGDLADWHLPRDMLTRDQGSWGFRSVPQLKDDREMRSYHACDGSPAALSSSQQNRVAFADWLIK